MSFRLKKRHTKLNLLQSINLVQTTNKVLLDAELERKTRELSQIKEKVEKLKKQNQWLNDESGRLRTERVEIEQFLFKKKSFRHKEIVTLSDYHRSQVENLRRSIEEMNEKHEEKIRDLRCRMQSKKDLLKQLKEELVQLDDLQEVRIKQNDELRRLKDETDRVRKEQVQRIEQMKIDAENRLEQQRIEQEKQTERIGKQADREALQFIYDQSIKIHEENLALKRFLFVLIKKADQLNEMKSTLEEEQTELVSQWKLSVDLRRIQSTVGLEKL